MRDSAISYVYDLVGSRIFLSAFFSWFIAQLIKAVIDILRAQRRSSRELVNTLFWRTGGMPSSHSSTVTALTTSIGFTVGASSPVFILSLFYGGLVIRDSLGVRRAAGIQSQMLNRLGRQLADKEGIDYEKVKEIHGHSPAEVSVGILLGFSIGIAFSLL